MIDFTLVLVMSSIEDIVDVCNDNILTGFRNDFEETIVVDTEMRDLILRINLPNINKWFAQRLMLLFGYCEALAILEHILRLEQTQNQRANKLEVSRMQIQR